MSAYDQLGVPATAPPPYYTGYDNQGYQQGFGPGYRQQDEKPVVVIHQPAGTTEFGPYPIRLTCQHCQSFVQTTTKSGTSPMGWVLGIFFLFIGCVPCALIPCCCVDSLKKVTHKCPNCNAYLGTYKPNGI